MSVLLFKLNNVPDDEAEEVRELLREKGISFYETSAGRWGLSIAAIWLHDQNRVKEAKAFIDAYQRERARKARQNYIAQKHNGEIETIVGRIKKNPVQFMLYLAAIIFLLYLMTFPFISLPD